MAVLDIEGWEARSIAVGQVLNGTPSISTATTRGYWSAGALDLDLNDTWFKSWGSSVTEVWHGFGLLVQNWGGARLLSWTHPDGTVQDSLFLTSTGALQATRGTTTVLGTTGVSLSVNRWYWIDVHLIVSPTAGVFEIWIDEIQRLNLTGQNTQAHASSAAISGRQWWAGNATGWHAFVDDEHIYDTTGTQFNSRVGDRGVAALTVTSDGDVIQLSRFGSGLTNNYQAVDEAPPNDATDYVYSQTLNAYDLYGLEDALVELTDVGPVKVQVRAQKKDPGAGQVAAMLKYDSNGDGIADTESQAADKPLSTSWAWDEWIFERQPDNTPWTKAKLDALQVGVKMR